MKKQILFIAICFLSGVVSAQLFGTKFLTTYGFLNSYHIRAFVMGKTEYMQMFWNILWVRIKEYLFLALLGFTPVRKILPQFIKSVLAYTFGLFLWACVMNMGLYGILVCVCCIFPQGILYFTAIVLLIKLEVQPRYVGAGYEKSSWLRTSVTTHFFTILTIVILVIMGALLEALAGNVLLHMVLQQLLK